MKSFSEHLNDQALTPSQCGKKPSAVRLLSIAAVLLAVCTPLWLGLGLAAMVFAKSPPESTATPPKTLQPVDTLRGTLSGLEGFSFGMTKETVKEKASVTLNEGTEASLNAEFSGQADVSQLQSEKFPVMPNETKPVQFVFRNGTLCGVCVQLGRLSPDEYVQMLEMLGKHYGEKGKPTGGLESFKAASVAFSQGRPHDRISINFDDYRVVSQMSWNDSISASVFELVFKQRGDEPTNPIDRINRMRSRFSP